MHILSLIAGTAAIWTVLLDAFETVVLPRRASGKVRLTRLFYVTTWSAWCAAAGRIPEGRRRETIFSFYGPLSLLLLLATWAAGLTLGFGLLFYGAGTPFQDSLKSHDLGRAIYFSGTTLFTLGLGDVYPKTAWIRGLVVAESGMGLGFVAIVIGYLPVLYGAFSHREVTIALLDGRAGSPPTAAELLRRHAFPGGLETLSNLLADWERWAAELLESHISYPLLCYFRSQHDNQSWVSALTAVLDASTLLMSVVDAGCARQAQLTFAMARHAIVDLINVFGLKPLSPGAVGVEQRLSPLQREELMALLDEAGLHLNNSPEALERFERMRGMYEGQVLAMGRYLAMALPPFFSRAAKRDTWMLVANLRGPAAQGGSLCHPQSGLGEGARHPGELQVEEPHPF